MPGSEVYDSDNKSYLHPDLVCQILHDLFGITVLMKRDITLSGDIVVLNLPKNVLSQVEKLAVSENIVGCIALDISFLHKEDEIKYIAQSLKLLCEKGDEFQRYYDKRTFLMNKFSYDNYNFHF